MRGLMMGGWFVATAIGNKLTAIGRLLACVGPLDLLLHPGNNGTLHVVRFVAAPSHSRKPCQAFRPLFPREPVQTYVRDRQFSLWEAPQSAPHQPGGFKNPTKPSENKR